MTTFAKEHSTDLAYLKVSWTAPSVPPRIRRYHIKLVPLQFMIAMDEEEDDLATVYFTSDETTNHTIQNVPAGSKFKVYLRAESVIGWVGDWSTPTTIEVLTGTSAAAPAGALKMQSVQGGFSVSWNPIASIKEYIILLKESAIPTKTEFDQKVIIPAGQTKAFVPYPYTEQAVYSVLYTVGTGGTYSETYISNTANMASAFGALTEENVAMVKKLKNLPTKEIDMGTLEEIASYNLTKRGKSAGQPVVPNIQFYLPINVNTADVQLTLGGSQVIDSFHLNNHWTLRKASLYQTGGDFTGVTMNIGVAGIDYVPLALVDASSTSALITPSAEELPSILFPQGSLFEIILASSAEMVAPVDLTGFLHLWYELE